MSVSSRLCVALTGLLLAAGWGVHTLADDHALESPAAAPVLADTVPRGFGAWQALPDGIAQVEAVAEGTISPYAEQFARSYRDRDGHTVMLTLGYVAQQTPYTRPHAPEPCYTAAGFGILSSEAVRLQALETAGMAGPLMAQRMLAQRGTRREAVSYWIRIGALHGPGTLAARWHLLQGRLHGQTVDGMLVRASMLLAADDTPAAAHQRLEGFLAELLAASPPGTRQLLLRS